MGYEEVGHGRGQVHARPGARAPESRADAAQEEEVVLNAFERNSEESAALCRRPGGCGGTGKLVVRFLP